MRKVSAMIFATGLLSIGCFTTKNPVTVTQHPSVKSIVAVCVSLDYSAGNMGLYSISDSIAYRNLLSIYADNDIRSFDGALYVLQRYGRDNIIKIQGSVIADSTVLYEKNIGASVNIQDIAFISPTKAYITLYGSAKVAIFNPSSGEKSASSVDLSSFNTYAGTDSAASVPYMSRSLYTNGKVYIACQRLKAPVGGYLQAADTSCLAVINAANDGVEKKINLVYKNPQELSLYNGKLYVAGAGKFGVNDGGIECIDLATGSDLGGVVDENALHGDVQAVIVISETKGYAVISTQTFTTELYPFNPQTKTVGLKVTGIEAPCTNHMAYDGTYLYIGDRCMTAPGIVAIDPATDTKAGTTKNIGLPPNSLVFLER
jgi:hypothetical protein